jgi:hypothetical protein
MKLYCLKDSVTEKVFRVVLTEQEFEDYLKRNPKIFECINCVECNDAPSITLE